MFIAAEYWLHPTYLAQAGKDATSCCVWDFTGITGVVWKIVDRFRKERIEKKHDSEKRKRDFKAWLIEQKFRIDTCGQFGVIANAWKETRPEFVRKAAEVQDAIPKEKLNAFDTAVSQVSSMTPGQVDAWERKNGEVVLSGNNELSARFDKVIKLL